MTSRQTNMKCEDISMIRNALLAWYRCEARALPWRYNEGEVPDPYRVWLSEVMLQQTTVTAVIPYFLKFVERWPTVHDLAAANIDDVMHEWAGLGYYRRARNLHACAVYVSRELDGLFPCDIKELKKLPGVGDYTSAAIRSIGFDKPATVVDGNVERVISRLYALKTAMPALKKDVKERAIPFFETGNDNPSSLAQSFMDLGATICTPTKPQCSICPIQAGCAAQRQGSAEKYPIKAPKKIKPQKTGFVYWLEDESGHILLERRKDEGMLGGMIGFPTSEWVEKGVAAQHIDGIEEFSSMPKLSIRHSFTHFDIELIPVKAKVDVVNNTYFRVSRADITDIGFPTLFKKALKMFLTS